MKDPHLIATTREGYYVQPAPVPAAAKVATAASATPTSGTGENDLAVDLNSAADSTMVYDGLPITITRDTGNPNQFTIHIAASGLDWTASGTSPKVELALVVSSFDRKGKLLNRNAHMLDVPAKSSEPHSLDLQTRIDTASPAARVRFVVRDTSSGKVGADNAYLIDKNLIIDPAAVNPQTPSHHRR